MRRGVNPAANPGEDSMNARTRTPFPAHRFGDVLCNHDARLDTLEERFEDLEEEAEDRLEEAFEDRIKNLESLFKARLSDLEGQLENLLNLVCEQAGEIENLRTRLEETGQERESLPESNIQRAAMAAEYLKAKGLTGRGRGERTTAFEKARDRFQVSSPDAVCKAVLIFERSPEVFEAMKDGWFDTISGAYQASRVQADSPTLRS